MHGYTTEASADAASSKVAVINATHVSPAFYDAVAFLRKKTNLPIIAPANDSWAQSRDPLIACPQTSTTKAYSYFFERRGDSPKCYGDPMFVYATIEAERSKSGGKLLGQHVSLGRGVDGYATIARNKVDPNDPPVDTVAWHVGTITYTITVRYGDALALARSIVANLRVVYK